MKLSILISGVRIILFHPLIVIMVRVMICKLPKNLFYDDLIAPAVDVAVDTYIVGAISG